MAWWAWTLVGVACWFVGNLLFFGWFALLSLIRGEEPPGEDSLKLG